jgi:cell division protein FtsQ
MARPDGPAAGDPASGDPGRAGPLRADIATGLAMVGGRPGTGLAGPPRRPRPRSRWRTAFFALAGTVIVAGVGWTLLGNRLLVVRSVTVTGTHLVGSAQVLAAADVSLGTPLLSVNAGAVSSRVEAISQVASVTVTKDWPDHLVIAVTERVPVVAVRMAGGGYDQVDPSGVIVRWARAKPAALPLLVTSLPGSALRGSPALAVAAGVLGELQPWLAKQVAQVRPAPVAAGTEQVTLSLRDGKTVQWGGTDRAAQKNRELAILLPGGARDIDVSSAGTVVTRLFMRPRPVRKSGRRCISALPPWQMPCPGVPVTGFRRCGPRHARSGSVAS